MVCCPFSLCWVLPFLPALVRLLCALPVVGPPLSSLVNRLFPSLLGAAKPDAAGCCPPSAWPRLESDEGAALAGEEIDLPGGVRAYVCRPKLPTGTAVVVVHDVYGLAPGGRVRSLCDALAASGFLVLLPDLFGGGDNIGAHGGVAGLRAGSEEAIGWMKSHAWGDVRHKLDACYGWLMAEGVPGQDSRLRPPHNVNRIGMVGFCWGGWVAAKASGTGRVACAVHAHPSWKISASLFDEPVESMAARIRVPTLLLPAADDADGYRDGSYARIVRQNGGVPVKAVEFPSMRHGFMTRGPADDPAVMAEVQRAMREAASFLREHLPPIE